MSIEAAYLPDRSVIEIAGEDRTAFLQGLITSDVEHLLEEEACFAGLLSPQGKILFDFFVVNLGAAFLLDCPKVAAGDFVKRLNFYKLRAKVSVAEVSDQWRVGANWAEAMSEKGRATVSFPDPRLAALGSRIINRDQDADDLQGSASCYHAFRVGLTIPEGAKDYAYGDTFPHEACFDLLNGVDFKKGCYVGQEVVSRMQHRGTARTRVLTVKAAQPLPKGGSEILAEGFTVGHLGSVVDNKGIALARVDRVRDALAKGQNLTVGALPVELSVPGWASYTLSLDQMESQG